MRIAAGIVAVVGVLTIFLGVGVATAEPAVGIEVAPVKVRYAPGKRYVLVVWSTNATVEDYTVGLKQG